MDTLDQSTLRIVTVQGVVTSQVVAARMRAVSEWMVVSSDRNLVKCRPTLLQVGQSLEVEGLHL